MFEEQFDLDYGKIMKVNEDSKKITSKYIL
jgi:hypothetical protein